MIDFSAARNCLKAFDFATLFREHLGWDNHKAGLDITLNGTEYTLKAVAQKRGVIAFVYPHIPDRSIRLKLDHQITKSAREHFVIYTDQKAGVQLWHWVRREPGKPLASRDHRFDVRRSGDALLQRLDQIAVSMEEEEHITLVDVTGGLRAAFDVDKVTKRFYDRFKNEHAAFLKLVKGIAVKGDLEWYTSLMLNRLMFVYFIQKKGFLDGDVNYLRNRLERVRALKGKDKFQSFYRYFLLRLFHDGLGKTPAERNLDRELQGLLGKVPYLNGGFFEVHQLEEHNPDIDIPDKAFEKLFDFFDQYAWHLDERPLRADNEINPDVVGYIFEKYINQKQMGAYYTKEDITEYISKNTIIPFLFDAARKKCAVAFEPESALWALLRDNPDRYLYPAVRHGVVREDGTLVPESDLPAFVRKGMHDPKARMHDNRYNLQQAPADDPIRLVTETWREYGCRRARCLEIRERLGKGDVHEINDLITLNLDLWQFARDVIINAEGPELLRAFWHAIEKVTVLDPTCGSGAFLFAALRILETLYSDCLARMASFIEENGAGVSPLESHGTVKHKRFSDFSQVLEQVAKHPNERYFVLKSIILNNLFGVDIMEEAVEICKLRLFLKLVAQVETADQIEPLPDIDFNMRAGNTLVGYATADQVRKAFTETSAGKLKQSMLLMGESAENYARFEENLSLVETAFRQFRLQQTTHGGKVTAKDKNDLRKRLEKLNAELDRLLAAEYGIGADNYRSKREYENNFAKWKSSHEPFHWFVDFYGIVIRGGFDVIIGNPPYVEYSKVKNDYEIRNYRTESCGNLYAYVIERCIDILFEDARTGMIVQLPIVCTDRMISLQQECLGTSNNSWFANFDDRPARLFDGLEHIRATIFMACKHKTNSCSVFSTTYNRWYSEGRSHLFENMTFCEISGLIENGSIPKIGELLAKRLREKTQQFKPLKNDLVENKCRDSVYFHNAPQYWVRAMNFKPYFWNERDGEKLSTQIKTVFLHTEIDAMAATSLLNSSSFYWWFLTLSDCRHLNMREIENFPAGLGRMQNGHKKQLADLARKLMADFKRNKYRKECQYKTTGKVIYDEFYPKMSKELIDEIDVVLAKHYGLSADELDFIVNYDIKYRMGGADGDDGDDE